MNFRDRIVLAAARGRKEVAVELASEGASFDQRLHADVRVSLSGYPSGNLFYKCIVAAAEWAGFVRNDPTWPANGMRFLQTNAPHIKQQYKRGFRAHADPIAYLESWNAVLNEPKVPATPDGTSSAHAVVRFHQDTFAALKLLEWKRQRSWLGPWTFHGAFKIYLLHEQRLWSDSAIDAVTMPMGGAPGEYSFEAGWEVLVGLNILPALMPATTFNDKMAVANQAHADVQALAGLAATRAIHVNSGIYFLGSA